MIIFLKKENFPDAANVICLTTQPKKGFGHMIRLRPRDGKVMVFLPNVPARPEL